MTPSSSSSSTTTNQDLYVPLPPGYLPSRHDVVCGRGRGYYNCPGNVEFRAAVRDFLPCYKKQTRKSDKTAVLAQLVQYVKSQHGGRFVKQRVNFYGCTTWYELTDLAAREKCGNAMREAVSEDARNQNDSASDARQQQEQNLSSSSSSSSLGFDRAMTPRKVLFVQSRLLGQKFQDPQQQQKQRQQQNGNSMAEIARLGQQNQLQKEQQQTQQQQGPRTMGQGLFSYLPQPRQQDGGSIAGASKHKRQPRTSCHIFGRRMAMSLDMNAVRDDPPTCNSLRLQGTDFAGRDESSFLSSCMMMKTTAMMTPSTKITSPLPASTTMMTIQTQQQQQQQQPYNETLSATTCSSTDCSRLVFGRRFSSGCFLSNSLDYGEHSLTDASFMSRGNSNGNISDSAVRILRVREDDGDSNYCQGISRSDIMSDDSMDFD